MLWIGIVVFVSTNIDDLFVLLALFADPSFRTRQIVAGQYLGMIALIAISLLGASCALVIPAAWIGLLGLIPLGIGLLKLFSKGDRAQASVASNVAAVAGVTIANGGDNVGAWTPVFASSTRMEILLLVATFLVLTGAACALARALVKAPTAGRAIRRAGALLLPWVLIGLGVYDLVTHHVWRLSA